jgi:hypothetical protein
MKYFFSVSIFSWIIIFYLFMFAGISFNPIFSTFLCFTILLHFFKYINKWYEHLDIILLILSYIIIFTYNFLTIYHINYIFGYEIVIIVVHSFIFFIISLILFIFILFWKKIKKNIFYTLIVWLILYLPISIFIVLSHFSMKLAL